MTLLASALEPVAIPVGGGNSRAFRNRCFHSNEDKNDRYKDETFLAQSNMSKLKSMGMRSNHGSVLLASPVKNDG